jgi:hypothetical protein|nr:MAG TPA: hypothetical protein [Herelleviridae sp.]
MNLFSLAKTSRTPMTDDEKGAIKRSARMGLYVVARVIGFVLWLFISLWITMWGALKVVPNMGSLIQNALGVTSANAPSSESFITYWVAPMLLTTLVISAGVIALCTWMWRVMNRGFDSMKRWVDRVGVVVDGEVTPSQGRTKKVDSLDEDEPKKKKKSRRR